MTYQNDGKGFSGFDDLVSDITKDIAEAKEALDRQSSTKAKTSQTTSPPPESSPLGSSGLPERDTSNLKWFAVISVAIIFLGFFIFTPDKPKEGPSVSTPSPPSALAPPALPRAPKLAPAREFIAEPIAPAPKATRNNEILPPPGTNRVLSNNEIRYCLSQDIRLSSIKQVVDRTSGFEVDFFNDAARDYNSRCGSFRYRKGTLEVVRNEVESQRTRLELEGIETIGKVRGND